jgi:hypothetical protein
VEKSRFNPFAKEAPVILINTDPEGTFIWGTHPCDGSVVLPLLLNILQMR